MKVQVSLPKLVLIISLGCLVWSLWPLKQADKTLIIPTAFSEDSRPSQSEYLTVTLRWPIAIRCGEVGVITLNVEPGKSSNANTQVPVDLSDSDSREILDLHKLNNVLAETRLDLANIEIDPSVDISQPLLPGKKATFWWNIKARTAGNLEGTLWLYLGPIPFNRDLGARRPVLAYPIEVKALRLAGLSGISARWLGILGIFLSGLSWFASPPNLFGRSRGN